MLKHEELVKGSSRVARFSRAVASSCPPPSPADNWVTASSGACQRPPHSTTYAFSFSDFNSLNFAVQVNRYGCAFVHHAHAGMKWVGIPAGAVRLAVSRML